MFVYSIYSFPSPDDNDTAYHVLEEEEEKRKEQGWTVGRGGQGQHRQPGCFPRVFAHCLIKVGKTQNNSRTEYRGVAKWWVGGIKVLGRVSLAGGHPFQAKAHSFVRRKASD